jgi:hypothetical protein
MIKILTVGGYDKGKEADWEDVDKFARLLGQEVIKQGHVLLIGCRTDFDRSAAEGARDKAGPDDIDNRLTCYVPKGKDPCYDFGKQLQSQLLTWDPADGIDIIPELIAEADVVIFVRGYKGLNQAAIWSDLAQKAMLPVATFGGAAEKLYHRELLSFERKYAGKITKEQFQELNVVAGNSKGFEKLAEKVISTAERVLASNSVAVMMSYTLDEVTRNNLTKCYENACQDYDYKPEPVTELTADEGIVAEIHSKIRQSAFVLADFTDLKPNVFYEFGLAQGLGKRAIVTAREGTELPFDLKDVPTLFWKENWAELQDKLEEKIKPIAEKHGRA